MKNEQIVYNLFKHGLSARDIKNSTGIRSIIVNNVGFDKNFIKPTLLELSLIDDIRDKYRKTYSLKSIKDLYPKVRHIFIRWILDDLVEQKKIHLNHDFFAHIDTEKKAYWLGILAADGYIISDNIVGLHLKDKEHIEKFLRDIECDVKINKKTLINKSGSISLSYQAEITSSKMNKDLKKLGLLNRKSLILKNFLNLIPYPLAKHAIRGYLDGDGSIGIGKNNRCWLYFLGTKEVCESINNFLNNSFGLYKTDISGYIVKEKNIYKLRYHKKKLKYDILNYLYSDSNIYLDRKYKIAQQILEKTKP